MTFYPSFPPLLDIGYSYHKEPMWSTRVAKHVSGRVVHVPLMSYPLNRFTLRFEALNSSTNRFSGLHVETYQRLKGFYNSVYGAGNPFLFNETIGTGDPVDSIVAAQPLGTGNGSATTYPFVSNSLGGGSGGFYGEPVGYVDQGQPLNIYLNGVLQSSGYTVQSSGPAQLTFATAPASGVKVTADFTFYYLCYFDDDAINFELFIYQLWSMSGLKFSSFKV